MKNYLKKHWFGYMFALFLVGLAAVLVSWKWGYIYSTNDDVMIRNIVNGNYTGVYESHVINVMFISGWIWKVLYSLFPSVSWYDLCMVLLHYVVWFLIISRIGQQIEGKKKQMVVMAVAIALLGIIDIKYVVLHQYTILTSQLASVAYFWLLTQKNKIDFEYWLDNVVIIVTLTLALWLRREAFLLTLPVGLFTIGYRIWKAKETTDFKKNFISILICCSAFAGIFLATYGVEKIAYRNEDWSAFLQSHSARIEIYDYYGVPQYESHKAEYDELGIDYADWVAIDTYNVEFAKDFNADKMSAVAEMAENEWWKANSIQNMLKRGILSYCKELFETKLQPVGWILSLTYVCIFFVLFMEKDKKSCFYALCLWLFYMVASVYFIARGRFPERVSYGMFFVQLLVLLGILLPKMQKYLAFWTKNKTWEKFLMLLCAFFISVSGVYSWQVMSEERKVTLQNAEDWKFLNEYFEKSPENVYCMDTKSFVFSTEILFEGNPESENSLRLGTWVLNSPLQEQRKENQSIYNLVEQIAEEDGYYILQDEKKELDWLNVIWQENGYDVHAEVVDIIYTPGGRTFEVIQMQ